jgi:hypothetical protein
VRRVPGCKTHNLLQLASKMEHPLIGQYVDEFTISALDARTRLVECIEQMQHGKLFHLYLVLWTARSD